jgi:signal peptidase I
MNTDPDQTPAAPVDGRIIAYRIVKAAVALVLFACAVKFIVLDIMLINTDQMAPTLVSGDRVIVLRLLSVWPLSLVLPPFRKSPVIFANPAQGGRPSCLRVAARSGDTIAVSSGRLLVNNRPAAGFGSNASAGELLPADYSPRDTMDTFVMPKRGGTVTLDSLSLRDFFFAASLIRQENPGRHFTVRPAVFIDGAMSNDVSLADFYLYKGKLDSLPPDYQTDWFFWDRLREYLTHSQSGKDVVLAPSLMEGAAKIFNYAFKESCIFLLADDWEKGFDSRYFGPVVSRFVKGRVVAVLWSSGSGGTRGRLIRVGRLIKIIW